MKGGIKALLMTTAAAAALLASGAASAQDGSGEADNGLGDIVVTAQRRAESAKDVPISVTAVSGDQLTNSGISATNELMMVVPGLRVETTGAYVQPTIRGISTSVVSPTAEANIATYVDGVYQTTQVGSIYQLPDVERIEVLKGPQGTLFGRNATGGAILINTIRPDLDAAQGIVSASYGRFDELVLKGYASVPLVDGKVGLLLSAFYENSDGFVRNLLDNRRRIGGLDNVLVRGKLRFQPWEGADFTLTGLYSDRKDYTALLETNYRGNNIARQTLPASQIASRPWEVANNDASHAFAEQWSVSLRGDIEVGPGTLTTTTAYTRDDNELSADTDTSPLPASYINTPGFAKSFQQELVYATEQFGRFRAIAGLFYYRNSGGQDLNVNRDQLTIYHRDKVESYSAFGELVFDATDRLSITGGVRYSHDRQRAFATIAFGPSTAPDVFPPLGQASWSAWTPRLSVLYAVTDRTNIYFNYSKGFKAGLFNTVSFQVNPVDPEKVDSFELGIKTSEGRTFSLNAAAFYYDYKNLQQPTVIFDAAVPRQELRNAASSKIYGAELSGAWVPVDGFSLNFGLTYLDATYKAYAGAVIYVPLPGGGNSLVATDVSGNRLIRSPKWSGNLSANYGLDTSLGRVEAIGTMFFSSKFYLESGNRVGQPTYAMINASIGLKPAGTGAEIRLWGKNLTNQSVIAGSNISAGADTISYSPPRTYGVELNYRF